MQLSMQCTWISLNLTKISNQARRWVEGVFSSSKYASSNQMCKSEPPKAGQLLFISPSTIESLATFTGLKSGAPDAQQGATGRSTPCVRCTDVSHVSNFESHALNSNGHLRTTGRDQVSTGRVRYSPVTCREVCKHTTSPDSCAERSAKHTNTGRWAPDSLRCRVRETRRLALRSQQAPDAWTAEPLRPVQGVRCALLPLIRLNNTPDSKGQRPVPLHTASGECFSVRNTPASSLKFPTDALENIHLIFSKAPNPTETQTPLNPRNSTSFENVLTPTSIHHQSACVLAFHKYFHQRS